MEKQLLAVTKEIIEIQKQVNARDIVTGKVLDQLNTVLTIEISVLFDAPANDDGASSTEEDCEMLRVEVIA